MKNISKYFKKLNDIVFFVPQDNIWDDYTNVANKRKRYKGK